MKRIILFAFAFVLLVGLLACAYAEISGDFDYTLNDDGTADIECYNGDEKNLEIPATIDGYSVTSIGKYAFDCCESLESVTIPGSVTYIGYRAFFGCDNLVIEVIPGGYAERYAKENKIPFTYVEDTSGKN